MRLPGLFRASAGNPAADRRTEFAAIIAAARATGIDPAGGVIDVLQVLRRLAAGVLPAAAWRVERDLCRRRRGDEQRAEGQEQLQGEAAHFFSP
jgi:hypothetical protein